MALAGWLHSHFPVFWSLPRPWGHSICVTGIRRDCGWAMHIVSLLSNSAQRSEWKFMVGTTQDSSAAGWWVYFALQLRCQDCRPAATLPAVLLVSACQAAGYWVHTHSCYALQMNWILYRYVMNDCCLLIDSNSPCSPGLHLSNISSLSHHSDKIPERIHFRKDLLCLTVGGDPVWHGGERPGQSGELRGQWKRGWPITLVPLPPPGTHSL